MAEALGGRSRIAARQVLCRGGAARHHALPRRHRRAPAMGEDDRSGLCRFRRSRHRAAEALGRRVLARGAVPRPDPGLQGLRAAARRQALRICAGAARRPRHHHRRDLGRYRLGGDRRLQRRRTRRHLHALSQGPHLRGAAAADDHGRRGERPCHRGRRHLRRLPGSGEGDVRRRALPARSEPFGGQLD